MRKHFASGQEMLGRVAPEVQGGKGSPGFTFHPRPRSILLFALPMSNPTASFPDSRLRQRDALAAACAGHRVQQDHASARHRLAGPGAVRPVRRVDHKRQSSTPFPTFHIMKMLMMVMLLSTLGAHGAVPYTKMVCDAPYLPDVIPFQVYIPENTKCFVAPLWAIEITSVICDEKELQPVLLNQTYNYLERRMFIARGGYYCFQWRFDEFESAVRDEAAPDGYRTYQWKIQKGFITIDITYVYRAVNGEKIAENVFRLIHLPPVREELPSRPFVEAHMEAGLAKPKE